MNNDESLAQEILADHGKNPRHFGKPAGDCKVVRKSNPVCGDVIELYEDKVSGVLTFSGKGCLVSRASASIVLESLSSNRNGLALPDYLVSLEDFVRGRTDVPPVDQLSVLQGVIKFPLRRSCMLLIVDCLRSAMPLLSFP